MIENLNAISFDRYGRVIHEGFRAACGIAGLEPLSVQEAETRSQALEQMYCFPESPVVLDIVDGTAILCISGRDGGQDMEVFLLDKPIIINPGVRFGIASLYGKCVTRMAHKDGTAKEESPIPVKYPALGLYPKLMIRKVHTLFYQEKERNFIFKGEHHDFWELTYIDRGVLYTIVDEKGFRLRQGNAIFYARGQHHLQWSEADSSVCFVTVSFDMDFDEGSFLADRVFTVDSEGRDLIGKILQEKDQNANYSDDLIICYITEFLIKLIRNEKLESTIHQQDSRVKQKIENAIVAKGIAFIHENIGSKIAVQDIAGCIPVSQSYLSSLFRKHMNMSPVDYINHYRLEKSKEMIMSSGLSLTRISEKLGYNSVHYFSAQFKQKYGISPSEYSKAIRR